MANSFFRAPPGVPTRTELEACLRATDNDLRARDHVLIAITAGTGLRVHEAVALDWGQLVTDGGKARHRVELRSGDTKGGIGGDIVLNERLRWKIGKYRTWCARRGLPVQDGAPLFVSRNHRRLSVRMAQVIWKDVQTSARLERPYHFHSLRHYFGTSVYSVTKDIRVTQVLLRHLAVSSTQVYAHVSARDVEAAVERI
jgi:site-specific recombinase XerD